MVKNYLTRAKKPLTKGPLIQAMRKQVFSGINVKTYLGTKNMADVTVSRSSDEKGDSIHKGRGQI